MQQLNFLTKNQAKEISQKFQTPVYVYSEKKLKEFANDFLSFPNAFGCNVRYAMKANSNMNILKIFDKMGVHIDASSEYEVYRAISAGISGNQIQISGQELSKDLKKLLDTGVIFDATSLFQLEEVGKIYKNLSDSSISSEGKGGFIGEVSIRINPGVGSGAFAAISTGGKTSAFGIWHEKIPEIKEIAEKYALKIKKIHLHIGSENTPESWVETASIGLDFIRQFPEVECLNLGGGFKKAIMPYEKSADLQAIGNAVKEKIENFYNETGRKISLEVEPGKALVINACSVVCEVNDVVDTGENGYKFIRTNSGMTEMPRVPMYGVQQPVIALSESKEIENYVVVGHACESGDILTCKLYDQEVIEPIELPKIERGDLLVVEGTGAYNASMSMKNYNSYPEVGELLICENGDIVEIRKRQDLQQIYQNEINLIF